MVQLSLRKVGCLAGLLALVLLVVAFLALFTDVGRQIHDIMYDELYRKLNKILEVKTQGNGGVERCEVEVGTFGIHPVFEEQIKRDFFHCPGMKYIDSPQSIDWKYRTVFPTEDE